MPIRKIRTTPDPILTHKAEKVHIVNDMTKDVITDLLDTMNAAKSPEAAGLAAPQVGISKQILVVRDFFPDPLNPDKVLTQDYVLINPRIISKSKETQIIWEGCLSVPNTYGKVERPNKIKVRAINENGEQFQINAKGFFATSLQHEIDHLSGILFTTKVIGATVTENELDSMQEEIVI